MTPQEQPTGQQGGAPAMPTAPQNQNDGNQPQIVYVTRPLDPQPHQISPAATQRYEESKRQYPQLNLSEGEYVISDIRRHPIGLLQIWIAVAVVIVALFLILAAVAGGVFEGAGGESLIPLEVAAIPVLLLSVVALLFGFMSAGIYNGNRFFLTNESVIQYIQTGLFSKRQQTVSLNNIEDASYSQHGVVQHMFNYGQLRLSTEGDETTYRFNYASNPEKQIAILNNAVEAFKNGRPISH